MIQRVAQTLGLAPRAPVVLTEAQQRRATLVRWGAWIALAALAWLAIGWLAGWDLPDNFT
jgi:hypothetical protein